MSTLHTRIGKTHGAFRLEVAADFFPGVTAIFGPSGSGKSTWLECIAGLQLPDKGRISLGETLWFDPERNFRLAAGRRDLGYIFQHAALFPHLTVRANVEYGLHHLPPAARREQGTATMSSFNIGHLSDQRAGRISGGERQRVALARTLVRDPECLLLDEPFSALDFTTKRKLMDDLLAWNAEHRVPVVLVTHALEEVLTMAERVVVLEQGRIAAIGDPRMVLQAQREQLLASL